MARCGECANTFEGNRQPLCPFCGAVRPRPVPRKPVAPDPQELVPQVVLDHSLDERRKRKRRRAEEPPPPRPEIPEAVNGSPFLDVEYAFGGADGDTINAVTHFEDLPERDDTEVIAIEDATTAGLRRLNQALGRLKRPRR
jgi:hypothetical protein